MYRGLGCGGVEVRLRTEPGEGITRRTRREATAAASPQSLRRRYTPASPIVQSSTRHACAFHKQLVVLEARPTSRVQ
jgi:hypothetical protein